VHDLADILACQMHDRRDDVRRPVAPQLNDVFAQVGFDHFDAARLEGVVEMGFLGHHRFAFDCATRARTFGDRANDPVGLVGGLGPMDLRAVGDQARFELFEIIRERSNGVELGGARSIAPGVRPVQRSECQQPA
jgi:hypothetical protein